MKYAQLLKGMNFIGYRGWIKDEKEIRLFAHENEDISNKGSYVNLMMQVNRVAKHAKGVSESKTLPQYYHHVDLCCRFLADHYNLKNLANVKNQHIVSYVVDRQSEGKSASTIKNDLAAIRYFHDQMPFVKHTISSNQTLSRSYPEFNLERRFFGGVDRRPTHKEFITLLEIADNSQHSQMAEMLVLARYQGLRIHEIVRLSYGDILNALHTNTLTVKGKGGLIRQVPLDEDVYTILEYMPLLSKERKVFVPENKKAHHIIQRAQDFIQYHRSKVWDVKNTRPEGVEITMHRFRHAYAKDQYSTLVGAGVNPPTAKKEIAKLLGHSREDITNIYLG